MDSQFAQTQFNVHTAASSPDCRVLEVDEDAVEQAHREPARQRDEVLGRVARDRRARRPRRTATSACSVTDRGIGISRREQKKIFRKFYRVDSGLGGGPQGCGLGLAIVDHTMRGHGGFVRVDSEPDRGSTFTLHFPIPAGADRGRETVMKRILVIEDEPQMLLGLRDNLELEGYEVQTAARRRRRARASRQLFARTS